MSCDLLREFGLFMGPHHYNQLSGERGVERNPPLCPLPASSEPSPPPGVGGEGALYKYAKRLEGLGCWVEGVKICNIGMILQNIEKPIVLEVHLGSSSGAISRVTTLFWVLITLFWVLINLIWGKSNLI